MPKIVHWKNRHLNRITPWDDQDVEKLVENHVESLLQVYAHSQILSLAEWHVCTCMTHHLSLWWPLAFDFMRGSAILYRELSQ